VWAGAPFANHGGLVDTVDMLAVAWVEDGLLTERQRGAIVAAAARSDLP